MVTDSVPEQQMPLLSHRLRERAQATGSWLCIGLDPQVNRLPVGISRDAGGIVRFCSEIIASTQEFAVAYKLNFAFFEALGREGWQALSLVRNAIPRHIPVVADAKRGDIGSTSAAYAHSIFGELEFDAATVNPYLGWDALEPFMGYCSRALFVLCRTSNPGSGAVQDLSVAGNPLYLAIADQALALEDRPAEIGLVVGATFPDALGAVRARSEKTLLLVPGVGTQGGQAYESVRVAANAHGENALIAVSRNILYASSGEDFAEAAARASRSLQCSLRGE